MDSVIKKKFPAYKPEFDEMHMDRWVRMFERDKIIHQ